MPVVSSSRVIHGDSVIFALAPTTAVSQMAGIWYGSFMSKTTKHERCRSIPSYTGFPYHAEVRWPRY